MNQIQPVDSRRQEQADLQVEIKAAQQQLLEAEAELAQEQAAVNRFRMHSRLMLDDLADEIHRLLSDKQGLLTELQLLRQEWNRDGSGVDDDPLGGLHFDGRQGSDPDPEPDELLLPTDTPRDKTAEKRLYRELARRFHPDKAETSAELAYRTSMMAAVNVAYSAGDVHTLYDLAGELEPDELAELSVIETVELRRLRERLLQIRRRRRKVRRQLETLRQESTARLWRKAQEVGEPGEDWWTPIRRELEAARARLRAEVVALREQVGALQHEADHATAGEGRAGA